MGIQLLSEQLASQIAAGEVVERPFSVVKELVENSIDAGATTINVDVREAGRELIQVADDGCGIRPAEIETAFLRHATSKLTQVEDLNRIETLGFRGEALAAIAAVSRLTVVSRAADESSGIRLVLNGGELVSRDSVGAPQGTIMAVEQLFYNVPARLKFLKGKTSERRLIDELITRYALAYPQIRFRLAHNGRITFQSSGSGSVQDVLLAIYGVDVAKQLLAVGEEGYPVSSFQFSEEASSPNSEHRAPITVQGYVGPPSLHYANRSRITLFVNGRWIKDTQLTYAVIQAYHTLLPTGRYPLGLLFIELPPEEVDVNVHPAKTEVRFNKGKAPFGAVQKAVRQTIIESAPVRDLGAWRSENSFTAVSPTAWAGTLNHESFAPRPTTQPGLGMDWNDFGSTLGAEEIGAGPLAGAVAPSGMPPSTGSPSTGSGEGGAFGGNKLPIMRVVGQVGASYIITEGPEGMFLIDQHAAHERILYEQFMAAWQGDGLGSQGLMAGTAVYLSPPQARLLEDNLPVLESVGFGVEPFGPNGFMVRAVPTMLAKQDPAKALTAVVDDLERGEKPLQEQIEARIVRRVCKTAAIKAGQTLSRAEMEALIQQLENCANPHTCPHGRPTLIHLSIEHLAREFGRT